MGNPEEQYAKAEQAMRYNSGKRQWSLVHFESLEPMVKVLEFGAKKYAPGNWMKGLDKKQILESMQRHLAALMDGQDNDPESNESHMGHIMCNAMFYSYFYVLNKERIVEEKPVETQSDNGGGDF